jgi:hypothetical protein
MTTTDSSTIIAQLQQLLSSYQVSPSRAGAAQITQLAQQWLAADPSAPASLQQMVENLAGADPFALQSMVTSVLPQLQQAITSYSAANPSPTEPMGTTPPPTTTTTPTTPPNGLSPDGQTLNETQNGITSSLNFSTAMDIINSALSVVGLDPNSVANTGANQGSTLGQYFWSQIVNQGITDQATIGDMITTLLPSTGQFQTAFPGYQDALKNGYVRSVAQYVSAEEGITGVMLQGGVPRAMINPTTIGSLISNGISVNEVATRVQNGLDVAMNAPAEVQNYFAQEFGAGNGPTALATVFLNPEIDAVTLQKMLAGSEIRGAAAASNLTISQGLSQRLADQGQTYASAQAQFKNLTAQAGLFQQTVGENSSQTPVPGTQNMNQPLNESQQGVEAAFGMNANAVQQVHQAALTRQDEFRGGGGASTSQAEGYSGLADAKPF